MPWGRGIGKSKFTRLFWYEQIARWDGKVREGVNDGLHYRQRGVRIVLLMPTFKGCKDVHQEKVEEELLANGAEWGFLGAKVDRTRWHFSFPGGSSIQWFGTREANSARGIRVDIATMDEADDIEPSVVDGIVRPWFSEPWSLRMQLLGGTPRRGRYGLLYREHRKGVEKKDGKFSFHASYKDAPETVDAAFVKQVKDETTPEVFRREWECDFDSAEGLVYPMFAEDFHVREPRWDTQWTEVIVGVDWGWEDPGVFVVIGVQGSGRDATCWVIEEVYQQHRTISWWTEQAKRIEQRFPGARWYADPSQPGYIETLKRDARIRIEAAVNDREDGVGAVADRLLVRQQDSEDERTKYAKLYIAKRKAPNLVREMGSYRRKRDPRNPDRILDEIQDGNDHCFVAGTMVATSRGEVPIEQIVAGDMVLTRRGYYPVKAAGMTSADAVIWSLETNGRTIYGTGSHRIWSQKGWNRLDTLRYGDTLLACPAENHPPPIQSSLMATATTDIQTRQGVSFGVTTRALAAVDGYIGRYGSSTTDLSRQSITSTTETGTRLITALTISSASAQRCTWQSISLKSEKSCTERPLPRRALPLQRGTGARKALRGTVPTARQHGQRESLSSGHAISAAVNTTAYHDAKTIDSATITASRSGDARRASTILSGSAQLAALDFGSTNTVVRELAGAHVVAVYMLDQRAPVYDLTVDGPPEFFANGMLVHNCNDATRYAIRTRFGSPSRGMTSSGGGFE
jgi:hypothetical protein